MSEEVKYRVINSLLNKNRIDRCKHLSSRKCQMNPLGFPMLSWHKYSDIHRLSFQGKLIVIMEFKDSSGSEVWKMDKSK